MRKIHIRFEAEPSLDDIDVLVRASARDSEVDAFLERISGKPPDGLTVYDPGGAMVRLSPEKIILISVSGNVLRLETERICVFIYPREPRLNTREQDDSRAERAKGIVSHELFPFGLLYHVVHIRQDRIHAVFLRCAGTLRPEVLR